MTIGDSWTFGSELRDPLLHSAAMDWDRSNDQYRTSRIWPTVLANITGADVVNLARPGVSNDTIIRTLKNWLVAEYISTGKSTDELRVIVGFTSPERKDFYYQEGVSGEWVTMWPMWSMDYKKSALNDFYKLYVNYFWNPAEYINRYVNQVIDMENFCKVNGINHLFFQAFYQYDQQMIDRWKDSPYAANSPNDSDKLIWDMVNPIRFMHKNDDIHSFHNYILSTDRRLGTNQAFNNQHPSEVGHAWWAEHINEYCKENKIW